MRRQIERTLDAGSIDRRLLLRAAALAAIFIPHPASAQGAKPVGSVEDVKGEAFAEARAERRTLDRAAPLFINDLVGTGFDSRLTLHLGRDTTLRVGQQARLTIDRFPDGTSAPGGSVMQIRTPFGLIAVRGTRFFAGPSAGVFGVFVERGSVAVSAAGTRVVLRGGQGTNIASPGAAPTAPAPWRPERIRAALESVE